MRMLNSVLAASLAAVIAGQAQAAVSTKEAAKLGTSLTPVGAEMAANADGSIPAYTGGLTTAPAGFKSGDGMRPDPFADEKPLLVIDGKNVDKYKDLLTATRPSWPSVIPPITSTYTRPTAPSPCRRRCWTTA